MCFFLLQVFVPFLVMVMVLVPVLVRSCHISGHGLGPGPGQNFWSRHTVSMSDWGITRIQQQKLLWTLFIVGREWRVQPMIIKIGTAFFLHWRKNRTFSPKVVQYGYKFVSRGNYFPDRGSSRNSPHSPDKTRDGRRHTILQAKYLTKYIDC